MSGDRYEIDGITPYEGLRNPVIDQLVRHKSVRSFEPGRPLEEGVIETMLTAAQSAPNSSNFQSWSVIVIEDQERKAQLMQLCDNQAFIGESSVFLVFCADASRHKYVTDRQGYPFNSDYLELLLVSSFDSMLAVQNASTAAESLGLGCCMVGAIRNKAREVAKLLKLPPLCYATVGLAVGYPARDTKVKPRLPQQVIVHREEYSTAVLEEGIQAYDAKMANTGIYEGRRIHIPGVTPEVEPEHYGWIEHTARRMARGNDFRRDLAPFLTEHGFTLK
ncbi:NADPH-dependent oxidoreductase [Paenibacillus sanguinis]|uniref:NADPH-dependent oxidoreductase n=1 Tax=Paenibacillus sanguinis TaxID=225906 RepID=UPI00036FF105|nr:NADPH-dependent oxidoreductase [Paenibacillus sanguinis]